MTTIQVPKDLVNQFTILSVKLDERRNILIQNALEEYLKKYEDDKH